LNRTSPHDVSALVCALARRFNARSVIREDLGREGRMFKQRDGAFEGNLATVTESRYCARQKETVRP